MSRPAQANGVVAAARKEAIDAGDAILRVGGNAVDAAIATAFALGVAEPYMAGIGGVGEIVVALPDGTVHVIDCAARAPLAATSDMFEIVGGSTGIYAWPAVSGDANVYGAMAVTAPRFVHGLKVLHERFGRAPWSDLVTPAAQLARDGVAIDHFTAAILAHEKPTFSRDPLARSLYYPEGVALCAPIDGNPAVVRNPALAETLDLIGVEGVRPLDAGGDVAKAICETVREGGGVLDGRDFEALGPVAYDDVPAYLEFEGWAIHCSPLPSGGITAGDILRGLGSIDGSAGAPQRYARVAAAARDAFARRFADFSGGGVAPGAKARTPTATTHLSVAGADGTVVAITQTLLSLFGAQTGVQRHGFFLNNGMMWFDPRAGHANSIAGGARALMAVSPMVAIQKGGLRRFAVGALGARRIITAVAQIVENRLRFGDAPQDAVNRPRIHADGLGAVLVDHRLPPSVGALLAADGPVETVYHGPTTLNSARAFMAEVDMADGSLSAGIDERSMSVWDLSGGRFK